MKDGVAKNNWFQRNNKYATHLHTTIDEEKYVNDYVSVAIDAGMTVSSSRSGRSEVKIGWSGLQIFHTQ